LKATVPSVTNGRTDWWWTDGRADERHDDANSLLYTAYRYNPHLMLSGIHVYAVV